GGHDDCAGQEWGVVLDGVNLRKPYAGDREGIRPGSLEVLEFPEIAEPISNQRPRGAVAQDESGLPQEVGLGVSADGDGVEVFALNSPDLEAAADRCRRKAGIVLDATEALFLERGDELAVADENCGD